MKKGEKRVILIVIALVVTGTVIFTYSLSEGIKLGFFAFSLGCIFLPLLNLIDYINFRTAVICLLLLLVVSVLVEQLTKDLELRIEL